MPANLAPKMHGCTPPRRFPSLGAEEIQPARREWNGQVCGGLGSLRIQPVELLPVGGAPSRWPIFGATDGDCRKTDKCPLLADSVAKVGWMSSPCNVRSPALGVLNLPCHVNPGDESMLRAS
jgi:hypothetical protein